MANTKVEIKVAAPVEKLYIVGSTKNIGSWDASKAVELTKCEACGKFVVSKMFPQDEVVEFKLLASKSFENVEKGMWGEELENHTFTAAKGLVVEVEAGYFAK